MLLRTVYKPSISIRAIEIPWRSVNVITRPGTAIADSDYHRSTPWRIDEPFGDGDFCGDFGSGLWIWCTTILLGLI